MIFTLNGLDHLLSSDAVPVSLDLNKESNFQGKVSPGVYDLEIRYKRKVKTISIEIKKGQELSVMASVNAETDEPDLSVK